MLRSYVNRILIKSTRNSTVFSLLSINTDTQLSSCRKFMFKFIHTSVHDRKWLNSLIRLKIKFMFEWVLTSVVGLRSNKKDLSFDGVESFEFELMKMFFKSILELNKVLGKKTSKKFRSSDFTVSLFLDLYKSFFHSNDLFFFCFLPKNLKKNINLPTNLLIATWKLKNSRQLAATRP